MQSFFETILNLARLGTVGVGVAVALMIFVLIFRARPVDEATAKLRSDFLKWGFGFAFVTGLLGLVPLFLDKSGPLSMRLSFSPDFDTEKLKPPTVRLPDGTVVQHDAKFAVEPSAGTEVLTIAMDGTLDEVRNLRQASAALTTSVARVEKQRDALAAEAASSNSGVGDAAAPALHQLESNSARSQGIRLEFLNSIRTGDYSKANQLSGHLQDSVNAAEPAVASIVRQPE